MSLPSVPEEDADELLIVPARQAQPARLRELQTSSFAPPLVSISSMQAGRRLQPVSSIGRDADYERPELPTIRGFVQQQQATPGPGRLIGTPETSTGPMAPSSQRGGIAVAANEPRQPLGEALLMPDSPLTSLYMLQSIYTGVNIEAI